MERSEAFVRRKTLLIINSSQVLMDITRKILERAGYSVRCAVGLAGAKEMFSDYQPDGIVLDSTLPDGKGLDYCQELRKQSDVPILFVSESRDDEIPALQAGADDFMKKPFDFEIMKVRINTMMKTTNGAQNTQDTDETDLQITMDDGENDEESAATQTWRRTAALQRENEHSVQNRNKATIYM